MYWHVVITKAHDESLWLHEHTQHQPNISSQFRSFKQNLTQKKCQPQNPSSDFCSMSHFFHPKKRRSNPWKKKGRVQPTNLASPQMLRNTYAMTWVQRTWNLGVFQSDRSGIFSGKMGVSKNRGTPKSSILIGFSIINHPFWGTPFFGNIQIAMELKIGPRMSGEKLGLFQVLPSSSVNKSRFTGILSCWNKNHVKQMIDEKMATSFWLLHYRALLGGSSQLVSG